jgi:hypothetical protein
MALSERDLFGSPFGLNDEVQLRGVVTAIVGASGNTASGYGGSADRVTVTIDAVGNAGEVVGATVTVSPVQCRRAQGAIQNGPATAPSFH